MEQIFEMLKPLLELYAGKLGFLVQVIMIVGSLRLAIKPIMSLVAVYVQITPSKEDDNLPYVIEQSKAYKALAFILDYLASIKIKK